MSGYVKTFKVKDGDKDKNNKFTALRTDHEKLLEKYKTIWIKIEDFKNIKLPIILNLPVYGGRYIKAELKTFGDKVYTNFSGLNVSEDGMKCQSFTTISINCLLVYENKYYL